MSDPSHPTPDESPPQAPDLLCPRCNYNLTGLPTDRCPECGEPFDRAQMIERLTTPNQPLPFGAGYTAKTSYPAIAHASLLTPRKLGRLLPPRPDTTDGALYGLYLRSLSGVLLLVSAMPFVAPRMLFPPLFLVVLISLSYSYLYEVLIAFLLRAMVEPRGVPRERQYVFWRTLCNCFSTHLLAVAAATCLVAMVNLLFSERGERVLAPLLMLLVPCYLWWWCALSIAITARSSLTLRRAFAIAAIPFIGLFSFPLAALITLAAMF